MLESAPYRAIRGAFVFPSNAVRPGEWLSPMLRLTARYESIILIHMSQHRLQVLLAQSEFREIKRVAAAQHMTVAEWVRQTLRHARHAVPRADASRKLRAVREAAEHSYPVADVDAMIRESAPAFDDGMDGAAR